MKLILKLFLILIASSGVSCENSSESKANKTNKDSTIANVFVDRDSLVLNGNEGNWYYKGLVFTGYAVKYYPNDSLQQKVGFYMGKKKGIAKVWFPNGVLKIESHYDQNKLVDSYKAWWENGVLASKANYVNGKVQGSEKKWYKTGELAKSRNLIDGKEVGLQQAWLKNGKLYVNYEAKNGRIFGMRRANSCYKLENEEVILVKNL
ncbi:hypothetical protein DKG77_13555 [Flagellimonas aquimarina]|uniref:Toxin-antitoxin system YwqK family antitoxin n=1 Tax=Flagellimonas aquimarina TaxID=2201895 RepID=A0A316KYB7_9FLAO|nr:toxin-antitoxin system YwqK family antitoxin [Allomuricauda koreensis]PWL37795.1 hypothetical protein DKG77_13555 [Allomuricauda koreensis]